MFGSVVSIFVNPQIEDSERQITFWSQPFRVAPPMRMPGRFEWKILGAVLLVAVLSPGTAAYALSYALRGMLGFWQQEQQAPDPGTRAAEVFRAYFTDRKEEFRRRTARAGRRPPARMADLAGTDGLLRARLLEGETVVGEMGGAARACQARMREGAAGAGARAAARAIPSRRWS